MGSCNHIFFSCITYKKKEETEKKTKMEGLQELLHTLAVFTTTWATTQETNGFSSFLSWNDSSINDQVVYLLVAFSFLLTISRPLLGEHNSHLSMLAFTCLMSVGFLGFFFTLPAAGLVSTILIWVSAL